MRYGDRAVIGPEPAFVHVELSETRTREVHTAPLAGLLGSHKPF